MERPPLAVIGQDRCTYLSWKGLFIDNDSDPTAPASEHSYWCQHSYTGLGPDGKSVDEYECHPGRACYKSL